jgi:phosphohistidine phosphatase
MEVYLVRHAIAHERNRKRWPNDALRPLTSAGKQKFRKAARGLAQLLPKDAQVFTSPFVRARETAAILTDAMDVPAAAERPELASGQPSRNAFAFLRSLRAKAVVLVGHEPDLGTLMSEAIAGKQARLKVRFRKGGAACVSFAGGVEPGRATLEWLVPPRVLRLRR